MKVCVLDKGTEVHNSGAPRKPLCTPSAVTDVSFGIFVPVYRTSKLRPLAPEQTAR